MSLVRRNTYMLSDEEKAWLNILPVGREFGVPGYKRLIEINEPGQTSVKKEFDDADYRLEDIDLRKNAEDRLNDGKEPIQVSLNDLQLWEEPKLSLREPICKIRCSILRDLTFRSLLSGYLDYRAILRKRVSSKKRCTGAVTPQAWNLT